MDISPKEIARQLQKFLASNHLTQQAFHKKTGIAQSQISRAMRGQFQRMTPNIMKLCAAAKIKAQPMTSQRGAESELTKLVEVIVAGSRHRERLMTKLLKTGVLLLSDVPTVGSTRQ